MIPSESFDSCRELLVALLEFSNGDPAPRRHAAYVYHAYVHALRAGASESRRALRWRRFVSALDDHLRYEGNEESDASAFLRKIVEENADLVKPIGRKSIAQRRASARRFREPARAFVPAARGM
jgi:hypothetical protein